MGICRENCDGNIVRGGYKSWRDERNNNHDGLIRSLMEIRMHYYDGCVCAGVGSRMCRNVW